MIGHRKFAWKVENLLPSEWFDLDRDEKLEVNVKNVNYDDVFGQAMREGWSGLPVLCPWCANGAVIYGDDSEQGNRSETLYFCSCSWCDRKWTEPVEEHQDHADDPTLPDNAPPI